MLGELIEESRGKRIVRRVLSTDPLKVEVTFEASGKLLGVDVVEMVTYVSQVRADGSLYGEGEGAYVSSGGDVITWKGAGVGKLGGAGEAAYRGAIYYWTTSPKFARLNTVAGIFEFSADAQGNTQSKAWEWK
jgi:hypothetical protein